LDTFELVVITKEKLRSAIQSAERRLILCVPGVDEEIAHVLAQATSRLPDEAIYIHIDPSDRALRTGYGTEKGVEILAALHKARIADTWRLGLLIADDAAFIYASAPEAKEPPPLDGDEPNGVILRGIAVNYFAESIRGKSNRPLLEPSSIQQTNEQNVAGNETKPAQALIVAKPNPIPSPREARIMDMVRQMFKVVQFHHSLTLADKGIHLTAKDFGLRTEEVDPQLSISFKVISDEDRRAIKKIVNGIDREVEKWTKSGLLRTPSPRLQVVWYDDPQHFHAEFQKVKTAIEKQVSEWFAKNYEQVQLRSAKLVRKFLNDDLFERVNPPREPRHRGLIAAEFRKQWVESQAKRYQLPSADEVLRSLKISYDLLDISEQMIVDPGFRKALEKEFEINLEEMLDSEERRN